MIVTRERTGGDTAVRRPAGRLPRHARAARACRRRLRGEPMAAAELSASRRRPRAGELPAGLVRAWLFAYCGVWAATLGSAALVALIGRPLASRGRQAARADAHARSATRRRRSGTSSRSRLTTSRSPPGRCCSALLGAHRHRLATHARRRRCSPRACSSNIAAGRRGARRLRHRADRLSPAAAAGVGGARARRGRVARSAAPAQLTAR